MKQIIFTIDDMHPEEGYGINKWMQKLHDEFGVKFTSFIVPFWNKEESKRLINNKEWVQEIKETKWIEPAIHGLYHECDLKDMRSMEFYGLSKDDVYKRIDLAKKEFDDVKLSYSGFKAPGWYLNSMMIDKLKDTGITYIADHVIGSDIINEPYTRIGYTHSIESIPQACNDDVMIITSHANESGNNRNAWNEQLYYKVYTMLSQMPKDTQYLTLSEYIKNRT